MSETDQVKIRYEKRKIITEDRYNPLSPWMVKIEQEKERALIKLLIKNKFTPLSDKKILEIGCGYGQSILLLQKIGFEASNIYAVELLSDRYEYTKSRLSTNIHLTFGDASELLYPDNSFDLVYQSMVFSSILDDSFRLKLADKMWNLVRPGGAIIWYDFILDNPFNADVKSIKVSELKKIFPKAKLKSQRLTLAPPIARLFTRLHPLFYTILNSAYFLRSNVLCCIIKEKD